MRKNEFLEELRVALSSDLPNSAIQENINYYRDYINTEISNGRTEEDVMDELGDPWIIARTIKDTSGYTNESEVVFETDENGYTKESTQKVPSDTWRMIKGVLILIAVLLVVFTIIKGVIRIVLPIAVPVLAVYIIVRIIKSR